MSIKTTCIGAYPKPDYVPVIDWFAPERMTSSLVTRQYGALEVDEDTEQLLVRAQGQVIQDQLDAGIDVPTDGEVRRENYIHYHCRHLHGFDFDNLVRTPMRNNAYETELPSIVGEISAKDGHFLDHDYQTAQSQSTAPIKVTIPGPLTIGDTTSDQFYHDPQRLGFDLANAINHEVMALVRAGCKYIQIDEPVFARKPEQAVAYGIDHLDLCLAGVPKDVTKVVHICCGYPNALDDDDYPKADAQAYFALAERLALSKIDHVSIEDAHRHNVLDLFSRFGDKTIILGVLAIARSKIEATQDILDRVHAVLDAVPIERLWLAPDCGLGWLSRAQTQQKLAILKAVALKL